MLAAFRDVVPEVIAHIKNLDALVVEHQFRKLLQRNIQLFLKPYQRQIDIGNLVTAENYQDSVSFSLGAEYQWTERLAVRAGIGYEISPVTDDVRIPLLPDNDRTWLSIGSSYHISKDLVVDLAYSHLFVRSTSVNISATSGNPWFDGISYAGDVSAHVDIISMGLKYRWDSDAPAPKLITK